MTTPIHTTMPCGRELAATDQGSLNACTKHHLRTCGKCKTQRSKEKAQ